MGSVAPPAGSSGPSAATGGQLQANAPSYVSMPGEGGYYGTTRPGGKKLKTKQINKLLAQQSFQMRQAITPALIGQLNTLIGQANEDRFSPEERSAFLAPRLQALNEGYDLAEGALDRNLSNRGLDTSSAAVSQFANLGARRASGRADLINDLFQTEEQRQQMSQAQARDFLAALFGGVSNQAGNAANSAMQQKFMEAQLEAMQSDPFSDILGGLLGLGGAFLGRPRFPSLGGGGGWGSGYQSN